jgi:hypothetical protein
LSFFRFSASKWLLMSLYLMIKLGSIFEEILLIAENVTHEQPRYTKQAFNFN